MAQMENLAENCNSYLKAGSLESVTNWMLCTSSLHPEEGASCYLFVYFNVSRPINFNSFYTCKPF